MRKVRQQRQRLQRSGANSAQPVLAPPIVQEVLRSPGQPLARDPRALMESRFGHDFSQVRVHTDARSARSAQAVEALAFTSGDDIVFAPGQYAPNTATGKHLLAHELVHVMQQRSNHNPQTAHVIADKNGRKEAEAEQYARHVAQNEPRPAGDQQENRVSSSLANIATTHGTIIQRFSSSQSSQSDSSRSTSSDSSSSGGQTANLPAANPDGSCQSAKVDVRATHIGGVLSRLPIWHLFIVYIDQSGTEWYFRGGPGGSCPGVDTGQYGTILSTHGLYVPGTVDWDPSAPSRTVLSGASACGKDACFRSELARIDSTCTPYAPMGPNSNTVVSTLLNNCSVPRGKPVAIAPGWGHPNI